MRCLFFSIKNRIILVTELLEWTGRWMLPDIESNLLPVTDAIMFSWFNKQRSPRKANINASLNTIVSLSAISMSNPSFSSLDWNNSIKCVLKDPPPETKTLITPFCLETVPACNVFRPSLHASANLLATCSANVLSRSGIWYFLVWKIKKNIHLYYVDFSIILLLSIFNR